MRIATGLLASWTLVTGTIAAQAQNLGRDGVALSGFDPVAYHQEGRAVPGRPEVTAEHDGATWRFASAANRTTFLAEPAKYLPAYGGYCAYGVSRGYKVKVDPEAFSVIDGRLYLNYDKRVQKEWLKATRTYIARADSIWPGIREAPRR
jgi:YHS domain-containing protein